MKKLMILAAAAVLSSCSAKQIPLPSNCEQFIDEYSKLSPQVKQLIPANVMTSGLGDYLLADSGTLKARYQDLLNQAYYQLKDNVGSSAADMALKSFEFSCAAGLQKVKTVTHLLN